MPEYAVLGPLSTGGLEAFHWPEKGLEWPEKRDQSIEFVTPTESICDFYTTDLLTYASFEAAADVIRKQIKAYIRDAYSGAVGIEHFKPLALLGTVSPEIEAAITASRSILEIKATEEDENFIEYSENTWTRAIDVLRRLGDCFLEENGTFIPVPAIGPAQEGSIDLFWELDDLTLLINVPPDAKAITFYGRRLSASKISGVLGAEDTEPRHLTGWLAGRE